MNFGLEVPPAQVADGGSLRLTQNKLSLQFSATSSPLTAPPPPPALYSHLVLSTYYFPWHLPLPLPLNHA